MATRHVTYPGTGCPVEATLALIGAKWKGATLHHLMGGELRFSELRRRMPNVTQRILSKALRELEADGLVLRRVYPTVPPQVGYRLTQKGEALRGVVEALADFGRGHLQGAACPVPHAEHALAAE